MYLRAITRGGGGGWRILAICSERHECELLEFLHSLPPNLHNSGDQLLALLARVARSGPRHLTDDVCHHIAPDIFQFEKGRLRLSWFYDEGMVIVCCRAFVKKSRKTPRSELDFAKALRTRYFEEKKRKTISVFEEL